jgi:aminomuconate-semialdehyde/2-hydroxymuconate-6-semialdehyde dehydrogenase
VVVKPSEETPSTATLLGEVMNKVGMYPRASTTSCTASAPDSAGEFLTGHPGVNGITFTGETRTGTAIMKAAAEGMRPVSLRTRRQERRHRVCRLRLRQVRWTPSPARAFENCGQVCLGTERVYVERPIFDKFVAALKARPKR